jgi:hypothetical protein
MQINGGRNDRLRAITPVRWRAITTVPAYRCGNTRAIYASDNFYQAAGGSYQPFLADLRLHAALFRRPGGYARDWTIAASCWKDGSIAGRLRGQYHQSTSAAPGGHYDSIKPCRAGVIGDRRKYRLGMGGWNGALSLAGADLPIPPPAVRLFQRLRRRETRRAT